MSDYDGSRGYGSSGDRDPLPKRVPCSKHPDAPHGFDRNGSHNNDRYTCYCEGLDEMMIDSIIGEIQSKIDENAGYWDDTEWKEQISYMKGLKENEDE